MNNTFRRSCFIFELIVVTIMFILLFWLYVTRAGAQSEQLYYFPQVVKFPPNVRVEIVDHEAHIYVTALNCSSAWAEFSYTEKTAQIIPSHPWCYDPDEQPPFDTIGARLLVQDLPPGTIREITVSVYYPGGYSWRGVIVGPWEVE